MGIVLIPLMMIYFILAGGILILVIKYTKRTLYRYLTVAVLILIPAWDVILGLIVFLPACLVVPKVAIYETAETDGIYYEGMYDYIRESKVSGKPLSERTRLGFDPDFYFYRDYRYIEAKVTKKSTGMGNYVPIRSKVYHCTLLPSDRGPQFKRTNCVVVDQPLSRYVVKASQKKFLMTSIESKKIFDRSNGKLMAEYRQVTISEELPFFHWLGWQPKGGSLEHCPKGSRYYYFEYEVLPKNKQRGE